MAAQRTIDVSQLPTYAFGHHALTWWATWSMLLMEGTMLLILVASYFFLRTGVAHWPPGTTPPPNLFWGTLNTIIIVVSFFPNHLAKKASENLNLQGVKLWTIVTFAPERWSSRAASAAEFFPPTITTRCRYDECASL